MKICSGFLTIDIRVGRTRGELTGMLSRRPAGVPSITLGEDSECVAATYSILAEAPERASLHIGIVSEGLAEPVLLSLPNSPFIFVAYNESVAAIRLSDGEVVTKLEHVGPVLELTSYGETGIILATYETGFSAYSPLTGRLVWDRCLGDIITDYAISEGIISAKGMEGDLHEIRLLDGQAAER